MIRRLLVVLAGVILYTFLVSTDINIFVALLLMALGLLMVVGSVIQIMRNG